MFDLFLALLFAWLITGGGPTYVRDTRTRASGPMKARAREHGTSSVSWWALRAGSATRYVVVAAWRGWGHHVRWARARIDAYRARKAEAARPEPEPEPDPQPPLLPVPPEPKRFRPPPVPPEPWPSTRPGEPAVRLVPVPTIPAAPNGGSMITEATGYEEILAAFDEEIEHQEEADERYELRMAQLRAHNADDETVEAVSRQREANETALAAAREARQNWVDRHGAVYDVKTATGARGDEAMYGT